MLAEVHGLPLRLYTKRLRGHVGSGFSTALFVTFQMVDDRARLWFDISSHARTLLFSSILLLTLAGSALSALR